MRSGNGGICKGSNKFVSISFQSPIHCPEIKEISGIIYRHNSIQTYSLVRQDNPPPYFRARLLSFQKSIAGLWDPDIHVNCIDR
jgi:hypothetical protein